MTASPRGSYGQILKSTTLVGGSQVINILLGIVRTKFMAVLLGPEGIGLAGLYQAATGLVGTLTGLGVGSSGVRQIAEAAGTGDETAIARTIVTLRRIALILGVIGMLVTIVLCRPLSRATFGNGDQAPAIALLSLTLLFGSISGGQTALIQGLRRIRDLASLSVLGAFFGTLLGIPIIYLWGRNGIVPMLIAVSATGILTSWWYARKIPLRSISIGWRETFAEGRGLLKLGLVFMASSLMSSAVMYLIRVIIVRDLGLDGVGLYQAANTLSNLYIGFILGAMGMDFYPRLTAVAHDNPTCNRLVNEQTEVGLLIAAPGIVATLTFAPLVIHLFYSAAFVPAYEVLRWQILGIFLRVISWPMGFVLLAKGRGRVFFWTELAANAAHLGLVQVGVALHGLEGTGMAFCALYVLHTGMMLVVIGYLSGFRWSRAVVRLLALIAPCVVAAFLLPKLFAPRLAMALGGSLTLVLAGHSLHRLGALLGPEWRLGALPARLKSLFHLGKSI